MAVPIVGTDKCRQPVPAGLLHYHVQRFGMVSGTLLYSKELWHTTVARLELGLACF